MLFPIIKRRLTLQSQLNESLSAQTSDTTQPLLASEDEILFNSNGILTLGVEIELQLIDAESIQFMLSSRRCFKCCVPS
ncbi:hypothetical protein [Legionella resiliens]|uniref:Uncharacterized protein n=1 Tax=Legionella resiliens TaxID=2905958 RepID=A0ABS8WYC2_9GAMM|nr:MULTISPECIES: hypothetical protein [unclassified Legionella]MCE0722342.1 hypothetical protein [Legionella sp. 9fVS26]MCE3531496.1 hypothetical protein [Legionella sp. 8cVS16]